MRTAMIDALAPGRPVRSSFPCGTAAEDSPWIHHLEPRNLIGRRLTAQNHHADPSRHAERALAGTELPFSGKYLLMRNAEQVERTDAQVVQDSLTDPDAFAVLFDRHAGPVHRYITKQVNQHEAEDLVGETFAAAFRSRSSFDLDRTDARPWLFGIATNLIRHHWRAEGRRLRRESAGVVSEAIGDPGDEASSTVFFQGHAQPIVWALGQLDPASLDVLLLVAGPGLSYEEVAIALEIPVGTVRSRLSRARRFLRELLGDSGQYLDNHASVDLPSTATEGSL